MVRYQKSLDCARGIYQKAKLKKKKKTRKDTENVEALGMSMEMTLSITNKLLKFCSMKISASFICLVAFEVSKISVARRLG